MQKYFNVNLEFDVSKVNERIESAILDKGKGYICVIESNNLTIANTRIDFNDVVNSAFVNICDGSVIASFLGKIHKKNFTSYTGSDIFKDFINKKRHRHYFLGNTREILDGLMNNLREIDSRIVDMSFVELPFRSVEHFDYAQIAADINKDCPDIIWVSLGAPKQEYFMAKLLPYLNRGVMLGVGAVFNFRGRSNHVKRAPLWMRRLKLEWLYRACEEPKKNIPRYWGFIKIMPSLILAERRKVKEQKQ